MKKKITIKIPSIPTNDSETTATSRSGIFSGQVSLKSARNALKRTNSKSKFNYKEAVKNTISKQSQFPSKSAFTKIEDESLSNTETIDSRTNASKHWKLLRSTKDILAKKSVIDKYLSRKYIHKSEIPSTKEIYHALMRERHNNFYLLQKRKSQFYTRKSSVNEPFGNIQDVARRELLAKKAQKNRLKNNQLQLSQLIDIIRTEPKERSFKQLELVLSWMLTHCPKNACVYEFLGKAKMPEAMEFCRGLKYCIYDQSEPIIRQNEIGDNYYVLLSGRASVFVNKHLSEPDNHDVIANEDLGKNDSRGLGVKVDIIHAGRDFGEIALLDKVPRTASIVSSKLSASECLVCSSSHFQKCMESFSKRSQDEFIRDLRKFYIMRSIDDTHINQICKRFQRVELFAGNVLHVQGCHVENVYLMISGQCAEWYEMSNVEMRNGTKSKAKSRKSVSEIDENDHEEKSDEKENEHEIAAQFKRIELSLLECDNYNTVIGGYYALKKKVAPTSIVCKTDCVAIMCTAANFYKSANIPIYERMRQIGQMRHEMTLKRIENYKKTAIALSKVVTLSKEESKIIKKKLRARSKSAIFIANNAHLERESQVFEFSSISARPRASQSKTPRKIVRAGHGKGKSTNLQMYSYIGPKDNLPTSQNKRYRSVSLMLQPNMSIQKSVKVQHDHSVKLQKSAKIQKDIIHHELPKKFENTNKFTNGYFKTKQRFRSSSMTDLRKKYGAPTDIWQIDIKHERSLQQSFTMKDVITSKDKRTHKHYNSFAFSKRIKRKRSKSVANLMDHTKAIVKEYGDIIDRKSNDRPKTQNRKISRKGTSMKQGFVKRRRKSKSLAIFGKDLMDSINELEYRKLKDSYSVLNVAFKQSKKDGLRIKHKKRGIVAVKGRHKLNALSKNVVQSRSNYQNF